MCNFYITSYEIFVTLICNIKYFFNLKCIQNIKKNPTNIKKILM